MVKQPFTNAKLQLNEGTQKKNRPIIIHLHKNRSTLLRPKKTGICIWSYKSSDHINI